VFETDVLAALLRTIREFVRSPAVTRQMMDRSEKVLADHVRALLFLVADGAPPPDKDGRSRLVRILIRRIVAHQMILGISSLGFLPAVTGALVEQYEGDRALRLKQAQATFMAYMAQEAPRFGRAVVKGEHELARLLAQKGSGTLTGVELVDLEKRHGMPNALLEAFLERRGLAFDREQYGQALEQWQASMRAETR